MRAVAVQDVITNFSHYMKLHVSSDEPHHWMFADTLELYGPDHRDNATGRWEVYCGRIVPGVRYTSNGDGWPDDYEIDPVGSFDKLEDALMEIVKIYAQDIIHNAVFDAEMAADLIEEVNE